MKFETDYIEKLAKIIKEQDLSEISLEDGEQAITIRKDVIVSSAPSVALSTPAIQPVSAPASAPIEAPSEAKEEKKSGTPITSPMVGTFYMAPSPDSAPFVSVGGSVKQGDVVCIIEAMKMMNEIKSEIAGKVVEFGQILMYVE